MGFAGDYEKIVERYCSPSGYVYSNGSTSRSRSGGTQNPARLDATCPICSVKLRSKNLDRHLKKSHQSLEITAAPTSQALGVVSVQTTGVSTPPELVPGLHGNNNLVRECSLKANDLKNAINSRSELPPPLNSPYTPPSIETSVSSVRILRVADLLHAKSSILRLEEFMRWDSLGEGWASRREDWVEEICSASAVNELCQLVAEFESHILWEVSEEGWESARDDWHAGFIDATEMSSLVGALIVLEDHVCFRAFLDGWVGERVHWGRMVQWSDSD